METKTKRIILFLFGCMLTRFMLVWIAYRYPKLLPLMGYLAIIPAIGFALIYISGSRKTGPEVFGDVIWWNNLRPIHAILFAIFAYMAINKQKDHAWKILLIDAVIGLMAFIIHHSK